MLHLSSKALWQRSVHTTVGCQYCLTCGDWHSCKRVEALSTTSLSTEGVRLYAGVQQAVVELFVLLQPCLSRPGCCCGAIASVLQVVDIGGVPCKWAPC